MKQIPEHVYRDSLYEKLFNDEDARACRDIDEAACREVPHNFRRLLTGHAASKLADTLASPKTVLTWLLTGLGAPAALVAWLVPIREAGSMLPQLLIGGWVRRLPLRKQVWALGSVAQGLALFGMAVTALWMDGLGGGLAVLGWLALFSLARAFCSVAAKDVMGKTMAKQRRGRVTGISSSVAGGIALGAGVLLAGLSKADDRTMTVSLVALAGAVWMVAAAAFARLQETPGETDGGINGIAAALKSLRLIADDPPFRHFVISRALLLVSALAAPYFLVLARETDTGGTLLAGLGSFVIAAGLADLLSSPFWGRFADISARRTMQWAGGFASLLTLAVVSVAVGAPDLADQPGWYPLVFFLLSVAHAGVRLGRKTYLVDLGRGNRRTAYVSVSNTVIGALLLLSGLLGLLTVWIGTTGLLLVLAGLGLAGVAMAQRLPETQHDA